MTNLMRKLLIIVVLPPAMCAAFVQTLFREIGYALQNAWRDVRMEIDAARRMWRGDLP